MQPENSCRLLWKLVTSVVICLDRAVLVATMSTPSREQQNSKVCCFFNRAENYSTVENSDS